MLHFDRYTSARKGVLLKYRSFSKFQDPPILQGRMHRTELSELGFGHNFLLGCQVPGALSKVTLKVGKRGIPEKG